MKIKNLALAITLLVITNTASAEQFIETAEIVQLHAYQDWPTHFVWLDVGTTTECAAQGGAQTLNFDESKPGGKGMLAMMTSALLNKRKVSIRSTGCAITEMRLK